MLSVQQMRNAEFKDNYRKAIEEFYIQKEKFLSHLTSYENRYNFIVMMGVASFDSLISYSESEIRTLHKIASDKLDYERLRSMESKI